MNTTILQLVAIYNIKIHVSAVYVGHHQFVQRTYQDADNSLSRPGRKQARKHVRDARDFNNIETRAVIKFLFLQGKEPKEIHAIMTEILACFLPDRAKDLSTFLY